MRRGASAIAADLADMRSYGEFVPEDPEEADRRIMFASRGGAHELCNLESASLHEDFR